MTNTFPKLFTALGAAAFLFAVPLAAQDSGAGVGGFDVVPFQDFDERVTPDHRTAMSMIIAKLARGRNCTIDQVRCISKSFPGFLDILKKFR